MINYKKIFGELNEMSPYVDELEKMEHKIISSISISQLSRAWKLLKYIPDEDIRIYEARYGYGFIAGKIIVNMFEFYVDVSVDDIFRNAPIFLKNALQVSNVSVVEKYKERGFTKTTYKTIIEKYTLISDTEQYQASKKLWQSVSREPDVFVYIWNNSNDSFILENDKPKRFNGNNIDEIEIFGTENEHYKIVLVASSKEIK